MKKELTRFKMSPVFRSSPSSGGRGLVGGCCGGIGGGGGNRTEKCRIYSNQHCQKPNLLVQYYNGSQLCHVHLGALNVPLIVDTGCITVLLPAYHQCNTLTPPPTPTTKKEKKKENKSPLHTYPPPPPPPRPSHSHQSFPTFLLRKKSPCRELVL